eukprot:3476786-Prymnesium_polylepis.1
MGNLQRAGIHKNGSAAAEPSQHKLALAALERKAEKGKVRRPLVDGAHAKAAAVAARAQRQRVYSASTAHVHNAHAQRRRAHSASTAHVHSACAQHQRARTNSRVRKGRVRDAASCARGPTGRLRARTRQGVQTAASHSQHAMAMNALKGGGVAVGAEGEESRQASLRSTARARPRSTARARPRSTARCPPALPELANCGGSTRGGRPTHRR